MLEIYDTEVIYSWTPREFKNFIKGVQLRKIDLYELSAISAIFNAKVKSKKSVKLKDIYDAEKARKEIIKGVTKESGLHLDRYLKAKEAMKNYKPNN
ncbi:MAG: hypothetical protein R3267_11695 [Paenisporosarcina sp.]|nr:hypothetical protein [Paenisporosarcina sp.]